jgi:cytochrome c peroxidase
LVATTGIVAQILPPPPVPPGNPLTPDKVLLGKALFWDEQLSSSRTLACGTCHLPSNGGSDPRLAGALHPGPDGLPRTADDIRGSLGVARHDAQGRFVRDATFGVRPQVTGRRAPSMINAAYAVDLFWDGRASSEFRDPVTNAVVLPSGGALESQIAGPPTNDVEMSHIGRSWTDIASDLATRTPLALADQIPSPLASFIQGHTYASLFQQVFGSPGVTPVRIIFAIASYERTLISDRSPFDLYLVNQHTLTPAESRGLTKFRGLCANCHTDVEPSVLVTGPVLNDYRNIGVRPWNEDPGRANVTGNPLDRGLFRVPGMRNVAIRAPYFHNGSRDTLAAVIDFYARGGQFTTDPLIINIPGQISGQDRLEIEAFLRTLTDPRVAAELPPFDRPRLWSEGANVPTVFGAGTAGSGGFVPASVALLPAYSGNSKFTLAVDRVRGGSQQILLFDLAANPTPNPLLGQNLHLGLSPALLAFAVPGTASGTGPGDGIAQLPLPIPSRVGGVVLFGQWLTLDAQGPYGMSISDAFRLPLF